MTAPSLLKAMQGKRLPKKRAQPEFLEQSALFQWARMGCTVARYPGIDLLSSSQNGVRMTPSQAGKAKAAGLLPGEHDVRLPVSRGGYHGLSIEMKAGTGKPTPEQLWYGQRLEEEGWYVAYCWSWEDAKVYITAYLDGLLHVGSGPVIERTGKESRK